MLILMGEGKMPKLSAGYVAGFIDGEGCLSVFKSKPRPSRSYAEYVAVLVVVNTNRDVLEAIRDWVGTGTVYDASRASAMHKRTYQYHAKGRQLIPILKRLMPHLVVKRRQARLMLDFFETDSRDYVARDTILARFRELNLRGA
jgi:hypothetical protein